MGVLIQNSAHKKNNLSSWDEKSAYHVIEVVSIDQKMRVQEEWYIGQKNGKFGSIPNRFSSRALQFYIFSLKNEIVMSKHFSIDQQLRIVFKSYPVYKHYFIGHNKILFYHFLQYNLYSFSK